MRHLVKGRKLNRTSSHKKALMRSLATALFEHKKISTTEAKAKELRPYAEKLITKAKQALANENLGNLPEGQTIDVHNRRIVSRDIQNKAVLQELFDAIAPVVESRPGGYCRIIKTGVRRGDGGRTAIIELVDWSAPQDGATASKGKKVVKKKAPKTSPVKEAVEDVAAAAAAQESVQDLVVDTPADEVVETTEAPAEEVSEAPAEEVSEAPAEEVSEAPAEEVSEAPAEETSEAPAEETSEATAEEVTEAPAEEISETKDEVEDSTDEDNKEEKKED